MLEIRSVSVGTSGEDLAAQRVPGFHQGPPQQVRTPPLRRIVERCGLHPGPSRVAIRQVKEKWGILKFYTSGEPTELATDVATIAHWTEACTVGRCAITGRPGAAVGPGWILTLSPEMKELREDDFQEFQKLLDQK